ncbi:MAG: CBS domain-containing protein [Gracilimonas sp.]|nr:CBS domain-containing protein [Gracilimonas sp.]
MLVLEITNREISPLRENDTVEAALLRIDLLHTTRIPVIDEEGRLKGMASLDRLIEIVDEQTKLKDLKLGEPISVPTHQHLFEASRVMLAKELYLLPVVGKNMMFEGMLKKKDVLSALGELFNLSSFGSVITVELKQNDFTLSDLVRIIEMEGAKILGVAVQQPDADHMSYRISIKLNLEDSSIISSSLRRFGYTILSEANSETLEENFSERADELIRYLDI